MMVVAAAGDDQALEDSDGTYLLIVSVIGGS